MSKKILNLSFLILTLTGINAAAVETALGPKLGRAASAEEIARWEISVMPDGKGLPEGKGTVAEGESVYMSKCLSCHGPKGEGASADQLAFAQMELTDDWPEKTIGSYWPYATTLFDFNRRSMPMQAPGSLTDEETYAVTAYLLYLNGIISENEVMDADSLAKVRMPNRFGFIDVYEQEKTAK
ncbi:MAG: c-type cytochrome [Gammaproteobacteria bacterium]|nr:c-type cytochrome [Gammaproteobacteria bacterium]